MFTYAHVKWFYGQSECAYYLNYFLIKNPCSYNLLFSKMERHRQHHSFKIDIKVGVKYVVFEPLTLIVCFNYAGISIQENSDSATSC